MTDTFLPKYVTEAPTTCGLLDYSFTLGLPNWLEPSAIQGLPSVTNNDFPSDQQIEIWALIDPFLGQTSNDLMLRWLLLFPFAGQRHDEVVLDSITFSHTVVKIWEVSASTSIAFSDPADGPKTHTDQQADIVAFSDLATFTTSRQLDINDTVVFSDSTLGSGKTHDEVVEDSIILVDDPEGDRGQFIGDSVTFTEDVSLAGSIYNLTASTTVTFSHFACRQFDVVSSDTITFSHLVGRGSIGTPIDGVTFNDSAIAERIRPTSTAISFSHTVTREGFIRVTTPSSSITFIHAAYADTSKAGCDTYSTPLGIRSQLTLSYPVNSPTSTLNLRIPKFGDTKRLTAKFKIKRTLAGFPRVSRVTSWPQIEVLRFTIEALTQTQRDDFIAFIELTAGLNIRLLDHENVNWSGIIIDPTVEVTDEGRGCQYQLAFSFRGVRL